MDALIAIGSSAAYFYSAIVTILPGYFPFESVYFDTSTIIITLIQAKADGSRKSEYGKYTLGKGYENVISYDHGINIEHIMASGTLPEFYYYARVPTIEIEQNDEDKRCMTYKNKDNNIMTMQGFYCEGLSTITILS
jgi:hypothetical protein